MNTNHALYYAALEADNAWQAELVRLFKKNAGDIRYTDKGKGDPGSVLRTLHDQAETAKSAWMDVFWEKIAEENAL
jgi:hypothetical protein